MKIIVLGSPGVGKGTYTQDLVKILNLIHISTGDLFRENIKNETELGKQAQEFINQGKLVPDQITISMVKERLSKDDCKNGFILDGFPRTVAQAEALEKITPLDLVLNFKADPETIIARLGGRIICKKCARIYHQKNLIPKQEGICDFCGGELNVRDDDKPEAVEKRLKLYQEQAAPLIDFYKKKNFLREITINEEYGIHKKMIQERILKVINNSSSKPNLLAASLKA